MAWTGDFGAAGVATATFTGGDGFVVGDFAAAGCGFGALAVGLTGVGIAAGTACPPFKIPFGSVSTTCSVVTGARAADGARAAVVTSGALGAAA